MFHLFEVYLMEVKKTQGACQLKILSFVQKNGLSNLMSDYIPYVYRENSCLLTVFMFLSNQLIDGWLPTIIRIRQERLSINTSIPEQSNNINSFLDGEVNRLVGWILFAKIKI